MLIERTTTGDLIFGKVEKWKPGAVDENLTILTVSDDVTKQKIKVLCWNRFQVKLSDRARSLLQGEYVCIRGEFDLGDTNKCTAFDLKKAGLFNGTTLEGRNINIAYGTIKTIQKHPDGYQIGLPYFKFENNKLRKSWCFIKFQKRNDYIQKEIKKNAYCFIYYGKSTPIEALGLPVLNALGEQLLIVA